LERGYYQSARGGAGALSTYFPMGIYSGFTEAASEPNTIKDLESQ
jgi:hypothetical protein